MVNMAGSCRKCLILVGLFILSVFVFYKCTKTAPAAPNIEATWWGSGEPQKEDETIRPFKIAITPGVLLDLQRRLNNTLPFQEPLEGVNQNYGMNTKLLQKIIDYWKTKYDWSKRQQFLNQFPQFRTRIQGLNIHFIHVKPKEVPDGVEIVPILLLHGWPGSVREFYEIIPILTTPEKGRDFVFEVIVPSLPGYGFSDGAVRPGMNPAQMAQIFNALMTRLGFNRYYAQGGDWGSGISQNLAVLYPDRIIGVHRNWCSANELFHWKSYVGSIFPSLFFTEKEIDKVTPITRTVQFILLESGYFHLQASKPDTIGVALRDSPAGLAAYILEKFTTWTNRDWKDLPDGGLTKKFTYDQLLDNVMIYWITKSITTSVRLYAEAISQAYTNHQFNNIPVEVPAGCNRFSNELIYSAETLLKEVNKNLIHLTDYEGGHFAAFEVPEVLGKDIIEFVRKVRNLSQIPNKEL
ncbi:hypothetical protein ABEB36_000842 [Hypothenemus hampei]|uniref:Epoxide hydrolase n=1 Tax=Hypothenemus hampei TaxID=57062 RepID=A0ABD1FD74_HYPHA